ncbi:MAG TPA: M56 family metallopeptidase [Thermoanaerobaculia bacterium]|jgi:beta-lactamase regulating signal transducer with metallopeptidase domain|nr:M56 family metallopeptidase [Thermoanaerobaculia bacterium]
MNGISTLLGSTIAQAIGWALLHLLWQGVLVAAILAATLALLSKQSANARYLASCGALALLVVLGAATAYRAYDGSGELGVGSGSEATNISLIAAPTSDKTLEPTASDNGQPTTDNRLTTIATFTRSHLPQIVLVWLTGVLLLSVRLLFGWLRAHSIAKKNAAEAAPEWQRSARRLAHALKLRRAVQLLESAAVEVPTVIGWLRPVVLLPATSLTGLSTEQMEMILAHELAHIRRNDFFVNLMQAVVETLLFYHPAVWWISNRIRVEREHCCDDVAVAVSGKPLVYARALTRLEELRVEDAQAFVASNGGSLMGRIRRLAGARAESPNAPSRFVAGAALLTVLLALIIAPSLPLRGQQPKADPPTPKPQASQTTVDVKADNAADDDADDPETPEPDDSDDATPAIAPRAVIAGVPGGIAGGIADGVAGGIAGGVTEGIMANIAPMAIAPSVRAITAVAPRVAMRALAKINLNDFDVPEPPDPPDAPTPRPDRHRRHHIGEGGKLTVDDLIELRAAGVTPAYIDTMRNAGLGELSLDEITEMRAIGVTPEYIKSLRDAGIKFDNAHEVTELRALGVTGDYLAQMRAAGYGNLTTRQLSEMRAMGVTPSYVKLMADAGYRNLTPKELVELKAQGVRPEFIKSLNDAGYTNLSVKDLARLAAMGVNADFIRDLAKYKVK